MSYHRWLVRGWEGAVEGPWGGLVAACTAGNLICDLEASPSPVYGARLLSGFGV